MTILLSSHKADAGLTYAMLQLTTVQLHWLALQARAAGIPLEGYLACVVDQVRQRTEKPLEESPEDRAGRDRLLAGFAERIEQLPQSEGASEPAPLDVRLSEASEAWLAAGNEEDRGELVSAIEARLQDLAVPVLAVAAASWKRNHDGAPPAHLVGWLCALVPVATVEGPMA